jgi:hypothetical protein
MAEHDADRSGLVGYVATQPFIDAIKRFERWDILGRSSHGNLLLVTM